MFVRRNFYRSVYLTLGMACACLGYAELSFLPEISFLSGVVALLLLVAYRLEGRWALSLRAANFLGTNIRRTSAALKSRSEASMRFEKGLPPELAAIASKRATKLLVEVCGGTAAQGAIDVYPGKARESRVEVKRERISRVLGIDPSTAKVRETLTGLGFAVRWVPPDRYVVRVPYWRPDVRIADDVVEEVARVIGYDEIPADAQKAIFKVMKDLKGPYYFHCHHGQHRGPAAAAMRRPRKTRTSAPMRAAGRLCR